jgi:penicillin-binding protein 2
MSRSSPVKRARESRFLALTLTAVAGFVMVAAGLLRLQVAQHEEYRRLAEENQVRLEVLRAPRGAIFDREGRLLADSHPSFDIVYQPFPAESTERILMTHSSNWITRVSATVELDTAVVRELVKFANRSGQNALLRRGAPFQIMAAVEESRAELPGIEVMIQPRRFDPNGTLAAHLLGYAAQIGEAELDSLAPQGYRPGDLIGRTGVERSYEEILRGQDGAEYVVVNAMGRRMAAFTRAPRRLPDPGHNLMLTIDLRVQRALEQVMADVDRGAAVAIDPRDGGVLGMVSRPAYDPNEFSQGISYARWAELSAGGSYPLLNRALQGAYPPGSTFKIVVMAAALAAGVATPDTKLQPCYGSYQFGGRSFGCWKREGHGSLDFIHAIERSCDVYFYQIGLRLGLPRLSAAARALGFGGRTGIDLPQERHGLVPDQAYYDRRWGPNGWRKGLLLNLAIGQGELLVTPMQLALLAAEVARNGAPVRPHVVQRIVGVSDYKPQKPVQPGFPADPAVWAAVREGLKLVVESGTATLSRVPGVAVAGKTGTAQNPHGRDHALFVCYAPADDPTIAMAFVIENSGHGGSIAAPRAGAVLRSLFVSAADSAQRVVLPIHADTTGGADAD